MSQPLLILLTIACYFLVWMGISYLSTRGADNSTFFNGNRKMAWPLVAVAMLGAPITGITFVSVPGMVIGKGFSYLQMCLGFIVGYFIIALILIPIFYKLNIVSIYGYLRERFGITSYKTGAWLFFISKIFGISIRFLIVCSMLQLLVFDPLGISYIYCVVLSLGLVWLSTIKGGVKSVIWGDVLKSLCLISTIFLCIYFIVANLGYHPDKVLDEIVSHPSSRIFYFDDPLDGKYFWKQFVAGIFIVIAMTGLDQDMMQRTLACKNSKDASKNMILSTFLQFIIISLLLFLGAVLLMYVESKGMEIPEKTDNLFASVAFHSEIPLIVGIMFIIGIISATLSSVASALTSMTTTMSVDILEINKYKEEISLSKRKKIHTVITLLMALLVIMFYYLNQDDAISTVYTLISYTDGPILGLFLFGIITKSKINEKFIPLICLLAPVLSWSIQYSVRFYFNYETSFELLILNAALTFAGLSLASRKKTETAYS